MSVYSFRFQVIENVVATSAKISAGFAKMTSAAASFAGKVNTMPKSIEQLETEMRQLQKAQSQTFDLREIRRYGIEIDALDKKVRKLKGDQAASAGASGGGMFGGMGGMLAGVAASVGVADIATTAAKAQGLANALEFTSGGAEKAAPRIAELERQVDRMGLSLESSMIGFKTLDASLMGSGITASQSMDIFRGVSTGVSAMGLSADDAQGVFLALGQIASKGKVQAEELRGQIGERVPGALGIAADAMGVTTAQLDKMMERGELMASDFLPRFAAQMEKSFIGGLDKSSKSLQANMNRINNSIYKLKLSLIPAIERIVSALSGLVGFVQRNADAIAGLAVAIGYAYTVFKVATLAQAAWNVILVISTFLTGGLTGAVAALNAVFWANPIAWVIGLLGALTVALLYCWNNFDGFRGFLVGMWGVIKEFGSIVYDFMIAPLVAAGKVLVGTFTLDPKMVSEGVAQGMAAAEKIANGDGLRTRITKAFTNGWNDGVANTTKINPIGNFFKGASGTPQAAGNANADNRTTGADGWAELAATGGKAGKAAATGGKIGIDNALKSSVSGSREGMKNININIQSLIQSLSFNTGSMTETTTIIRQEIERALLTAVNDANYAN